MSVNMLITKDHVGKFCVSRGKDVFKIVNFVEKDKSPVKAVRDCYVKDFERSGNYKFVCSFIRSGRLREEGGQDLFDLIYFLLEDDLC